MSQVQDYETEKKYSPEDGVAEVHAVDAQYESGQGGNARLKRGLKARHICASARRLFARPIILADPAPSLPFPS